MKIQTWVDVTETGKKEIHEREKFQDAISNLKYGRYIYTIEKVENIRSLDQNNAMWGIPYAFFNRVLKETGHFENPSKEQTHEFCMHYCLPEDYKERLKKEWDAMPSLKDIRTGKFFKTPFRLTTKKMSVEDAMHYYSNMQKFYAENFASGREGDSIPDPIPALSKKSKTK